MILSDRYRFIFIHVPKCAGTSVRAAILPYHDADTRFLKTVEMHPDFGPVDFRHLPLPLLRNVDPDAFEKLFTYDSYALVRDPFQRFRSAMAQRAKMYLGREFAQLDDGEIRTEIEHVMAYLRSGPHVISPEFIHFSRQSDFVQIGGERIVRNLFPVERIDLFERALGRNVGVDAVRIGHANQTTEFRYPRIKRVTRAGSAIAREILPRSVHKVLRQSARRVLMTSADRTERPVFHEPFVREFIREYYAGDILLHRQALPDDPDCARSISR